LFVFVRFALPGSRFFRSRFSLLFIFPSSQLAFPFVALVYPHHPPLKWAVGGEFLAGYCLWLGSPPSCQIDCKKGPLLGSFTFVIGGLFAAGSASLSFPFHSQLVRQPRRSVFAIAIAIAFASAAGFTIPIPAAANRVGI